MAMVKSASRSIDVVQGGRRQLLWPLELLQGSLLLWLSLLGFLFQFVIGQGGLDGIFS